LSFNIAKFILTSPNVKISLCNGVVEFFYDFQFRGVTRHTNFISLNISSSTFIAENKNNGGLVITVVSKI